MVFCLKTREKGLWVIFFYSIASLFTDFVLSSNWGSHNTFLLWNIYTAIEYSILSLFFYLIISLRSIRALLFVIFVIFFIVFFVQIRHISQQYNSVLSFFSQANILGLCLVYLFTGMKQNSESFDILSPLFVIVIALLLYVACTLFLFIIANKLSTKEMNEYWGGITVYSNMLTNFLFSAAFLLFRFQNKSTPPENHTVDFTSSNDR